MALPLSWSRSSLLLLTALTLSCSGRETIDYPGEKPGLQAKPFAEGLISTNANEHSPLAFSPDGQVVLWAIMNSNYQGQLLEMTYENGKWSAPHRPSFADTTTDDYSPSFTPDGKKLLFGSRRKAPTGYPTGRGNRIWIVDRTASGWGTPVPFDSTVSKSNEFGHTIAANGNIYFTTMGNRTSGNVWRAEKTASGYHVPEPLPYSINSVGYEDGPYISPGEDYIIFESTRPESIAGGHDLYIAFRSEGGWAFPVNMGQSVNTRGMERFPRVSPDGRFLFFASNINQGEGKVGFDYYWVDAKVIDELKKQQAPGNLDAGRGKAIMDALEQGDAARSIDLLNEWLTSGPEQLDALVVYAINLRRNKDYATARQVLDGVPSEWRGKTAVNIELALTMLGLKQDQAAREILDTLLIPEDQQWPKYNYISNELFQQGDYVVSDEYLDRVISLGPNGVMYYNRACGYAQLGEKQRAFDALRKAIGMGYKSRQQYVNDPDLAPLRQEREWKTLLAGLE